MTGHPLANRRVLVALAAALAVGVGVTARKSRKRS